MTTIHTRQLQQYTQDSYNNYTQDNLKLATIHARHIRILFVVIKAVLLQIEVFRDVTWVLLLDT